MKVFAFISIAFVFLIVFGVIYTQWETKNFIESLPEPPPTPDAARETQQGSSVAAPDTVGDTQQGQSQDEHSHLSIESDVSKIEASSQEPVDPEVPSAGENIETQGDVYDWRSGDVQSHGHLPQIDPWQSIEGLKTLKTEGPNITVEGLRSQLVKRFGDIPQVHTFIELDQKNERREPLTLDEHILYTESMNHLFPHKETEQAIKMLKHIQQMQAGGVPVIILNPED